MTVAVDICNRALQLIGNRNMIADLCDSSEEAHDCNLHYASLRNQVLSMVNWNFARKTAILHLVKAAPGTAENPSSVPGWTSSHPAPPWLYEYHVPRDLVRLRFITPALNQTFNGPPIFSTSHMPYLPMDAGPPAQFIMGTDTIGTVTPITNITKADPAVVTAAAHGASNGQTVYIAGVVGMTEVNGRLFTVANAATDTFQLSGENSSTYTAYSSGGAVVNQSVTPTQRNVVLTNARGAIATYTMQLEDVSLWEENAVHALVTALAARLAINLSYDKQLAAMLLQQANNLIMNARLVDANTGRVQNAEVIPDWIAIRGGGYTPYLNLYEAPLPPLLTLA